MAGRHYIGRKGKRLFKITANKTNSRNLPKSKPMMRGGWHN